MSKDLDLLSVDEDFISEAEESGVKEEYVKEYKGVVTLSSIKESEKECGDPTFKGYNVVFKTPTGASIKEFWQVPTTKPSYKKEGGKPTSFPFLNLRDWLVALGLPKISGQAINWEKSKKELEKLFSKPQALVGKTCWVNYKLPEDGLSLDMNKFETRIVNKKGETVVMPQGVRTTEHGEVLDKNVALTAGNKDKLIIMLSGYGLALNKLVDYPKVVEKKPWVETPKPLGKNDVHSEVEIEL